MKKLFINSLLIGLILVAFSGCTDEEPKAIVEQPASTEKAIGGETDEHGCLGPAGYSWCETKQKCLRIWEEVCDESAPINDIPELITRIKAYNNEKSGIILVSYEDNFIWIMGEEGKDLMIKGSNLKSEKISKNAHNTLLNFFPNNGFVKDNLNLVSGTISATEGYKKDNMVCLVQSGLTGYKEAEDGWIPPEPDKYDVKVMCGNLPT